MRLRRRNSDARLRELERRAHAGDPQAEARVLRDRLRTNTILPESVRLAACLGYVPAQLAGDWTPPEPPFGSPDCVMLTVAQDNEWGHRMAALWAYALVKGTEWIWTEVNGGSWTAPVNFSMAPGRALQQIEAWLQEGSLCLPGVPQSFEHLRAARRDVLHGFVDRLRDVVHELDRVAFDVQDDDDPREHLLAEAAGQWIKALVDALQPWGLNAHGHLNQSLWGNRHTIGTLWEGYPDNERSARVPYYADVARETYRSVVWAVDFYRGGDNKPGPVMDKAQLDVESWARRIMLPEILA